MRLLITNEAAEMAERPRAYGSIAVTTFENANDTPVDTKTFLCCKLDDILRQPGIEFCWGIYLMALHPGALPLAGIKASGEENHSLWSLSRCLQSLCLVLKVATCFL